MQLGVLSGKEDPTSWVFFAPLFPPVWKVLATWQSYGHEALFKTKYPSFAHGRQLFLFTLKCYTPP